MSINSYKPGPGVFTIGAVPLDVSCQVTSLAVEPSESVDAADRVDVLCGETLEGDENVSIDYRLKGNLLQDLAAAGVVDYSWIHATEIVAFSFVPSSALAREVSGMVRIVPLKVGGEVKVRATSDIDWQIVGTPDFGAVAP